MKEKANDINFDALVSRTKDKLEDKSLLSRYDNVTKLQNINEYNQACFYLFSSLNLDKTLNLYYLNYYLIKIYQNVFIKIAQTLLGSLLILSFINFQNSSMQFFLLGAIFTTWLLAHLYNHNLKQTKITTDLLINKKSKILSFLFKIPFNKFKENILKNTEKLKDSNHIHVLALIKSFRENPINLYEIKEFGTFDVIDYQLLFNAISRNNQFIIAESLLNVGVYFKEQKDTLIQINNDIDLLEKRNLEKNEFIKIETQHNLSDNNINKPKNNPKDILYEAKLKSQDYKNKQDSIRETISNFHLDNQDISLKEAFEQLKNYSQT